MAKIPKIIIFKFILSVLSCLDDLIYWALLRILVNKFCESLFTLWVNINKNPPKLLKDKIFVANSSSRLSLVNNNWKIGHKVRRSFVTGQSTRQINCQVHFVPIIIFSENFIIETHDVSVLKGWLFFVRTRDAES